MTKSAGDRVRLALTVGLLFATSMFIFAQAHSAYAASSVTINGATTFQTINGFGFSEAFGQASSIESESSSVQQQILDLLFSPTTGAGFTILRNIIPSDSNHTIEPNAPVSPSATPTYTWSGNDWGQVALSKQAQSYGVNQFYADAWGAPAFMKTNDSDINGGTLCGAPGASTCSTGDWRQAYANYLIQYIKDYQSEGITLTNVGYVNEPNLAPGYSGMVMSPAQTADFAKVLGPTLVSAGLSTQIVCCDAEGWDLAPGYTSAIASDSVASSYVKVISSHGYTAAPTSPLTAANGKPVWETEWSTFDTFDPAWDDGSSDSGFTWAQHIYTGLTSANLNAFLYWWGAIGDRTDNEGLLTFSGSTINTSGRLWAMANYSRFIRPGAIRIGSSTADGNLQLSAYKNTNGSLAIVVLNTSSSSIATSFSLQNTGVANGATVTPYLTNSSNNTAAQTTTSVSSGAFDATVPARSLVTYNIQASSNGTPTPTPTGTATTTPTPTPTMTPTPTPTMTPTPVAGTSCKVQYTITNQWPGGFGASFTITNTGTTAINGWNLQFTFANGQTITQLWNGTYTQSGSAVTITNLSYNGSIAPGGTLSSEPGFNGTWNGTNSPPTSFTLNGTACSIT